MSQGCDCIIGGYSTYLYLKNGPIPVVTIKVSRETIFNVLEEAVHIAEEVKKESLSFSESLLKFQMQEFFMLMIKDR